MDFQINTHMVNYNELDEADAKHQKLAQEVASDINTRIISRISTDVRNRLHSLINPARGGTNVLIDQADGKQAIQELKLMFEVLQPAERVRQNFPDYLVKLYRDQFAKRLEDVFLVGTERYDFIASNDKIRKAAEEAAKKAEPAPAPAPPPPPALRPWNEDIPPQHSWPKTFAKNVGAFLGIPAAAVVLELGGVSLSSLPFIAALKQSIVGWAIAGSSVSGASTLAWLAPLIAAGVTSLPVVWGVGKISQSVRRYFHYKAQKKKKKEDRVSFQRNSFGGNVWEGLTLPVWLPWAGVKAIGRMADKTYEWVAGIKDDDKKDADAGHPTAH